VFSAECECPTTSSHFPHILGYLMWLLCSIYSADVTTDIAVNVKQGFPPVTSARLRKLHHVLKIWNLRIWPFTGDHYLSFNFARESFKQRVTAAYGTHSKYQMWKPKFFFSSCPSMMRHDRGQFSHELLHNAHKFRFVSCWIIITRLWAVPFYRHSIQPSMPFRHSFSLCFNICPFTLSAGLAFAACLSLFQSVFGHAIAQAVSRRVPKAATQVRAQVRSCGICGGQSGSETSFLLVLRFLCQLSLHWLLHTHHLSSGAGTN
jgi:hypothetical protein